MAIAVTPIAIGIRAPDEWIGKLHQSGLVTPMVVVSLPKMMKPATLLDYNGKL